MSPDVRTEVTPRARSARRFGWLLIAIGGVFIIAGWGIGHQEWARLLGWSFTGVGFAFELVYGNLAKNARTTTPSSDDAPDASGHVSDESQP